MLPIEKETLKIWATVEGQLGVIALYFVTAYVTSDLSHKLKTQIYLNLSCTSDIIDKTMSMHQYRK